MNRKYRRALEKQREKEARRDPKSAAAIALANRVAAAQEDLQRYATMHKIAGDACATSSNIPVVEVAPDADPQDGDPNAVRTEALAQCEALRDESRLLVIDALLELYAAYEQFDEPASVIELVPAIARPN